MNRFHGVSAGNAHECSLKLSIGKARRFLWDMHCGRKDRKFFKKAMRLLCEVIQQTGDLTLLTDGERRYGNLLFELCSEALRNGKRGRQRRRYPKASKCDSR